MTDAKMIDIHTHRPRAEGDYILAYSIGIDHVPAHGVKFSAGIHPWSVESIDLDAALEYLTTAPAIAIGEAGLDYARVIDKELQVRVFEAQLDIAQKRGLPVILHCVKAYNQALTILQERELRAVIFHGYTGSPEQTQAIIKRGYYISVNDISLDSHKTVEALRMVPVERIFVETDDSNADILGVYARLAVLLRITTQDLTQIIWNNYKTIFG